MLISDSPIQVRPQRSAVARTTPDENVRRQGDRPKHYPLTLSVIIPCYNEEATIAELLNRVAAVETPGVKREVLVVDDGSTDNSAKLVLEHASINQSVRLLQQPNQGKGSAVRAGLAAAVGELVVIQDADLEYDPEDWQQMLLLFKNPDVQVVFGSRRMLSTNPTSGFFYYWGAELINITTNVLYGRRVTDQFTCYKMMRRSMLPQLHLKSDGFEFDAELVAKIFRKGLVVCEVPIRYAPRTVEQGKKIRPQDGLAWLWQILKHRFTSPKSW